MWLFTVHGFFSVVCARDPNGGGDPNLLMIRARSRDHLAALKKHFPALADTEIVESCGTDYKYRLLVQKAVWVPVLAELGQQIEYGNFKSAVAHHQGQPGRAYESALHSVWSVMRRLQSNQ